MNYQPFKMKLHIKISLLFAVLMLIISFTLIYSSYLHLTGVIQNINRITFDKILEDTVASLKSDFRAISSELNILVNTVLANGTESAYAQRVSLLKAALDNNQNIKAAFSGYSDGRVLLLRRLSTEQEYETFNAPAAACYLVTYSKSKVLTEGVLHVYYSKDFTELARKEDKDFYVDSRARVWHKAASQTDKVIISKPYLFLFTGDIGVTLARKNPRTGHVIGVDYTLDSLLQLVNKFSVSSQTRTILINAEGQILTGNYADKVIYKSPQADEIATTENIVDPVINDYAKNPSLNDDFEFTSKGEVWKGKKKRFVLVPGQEPFTVITVTPESSLMAAAAEYKHKLILAGIAVITLTVPIVWVVALVIAKPLTYLTTQLDKIKNFDFKAKIDIESSVVEIDKLINSSQNMLSTIKKFQRIAETITKEREYDILLKTVLSETAAIVGGRGAAVYLFDKKDESLYLAALYLDGKSAEVCQQLFEKVLRQGAIKREVFEKYLNTEQSYNNNNAGDNYYIEKHILVWPWLAYDQDLPLSTISLKDSEGEGIGYIVFAHDSSVDLKQDTSQLTFINALSGFVSAAIENQLLLEKRQELLEGLIMLIANAIDAKSPYTGNHCHRVPIITKMIIEEACRSEEPEYKGYNLKSSEWEEIRIASWLHDCGKVVTPAHIIDKATKLECNYNRIHEIRMRFELLKAYADITYLEALLAGTAPEQAAQERDAQKRQLDADFAFVAECNIGREFVSDAAVTRLQRLAEKTWVRTLDDTLGLAEEELKRRKSVDDAGILPVQEELLSDKAWHRRKKKEHDFEADNQWGFTLEEPELESNDGELYNLSIRKGTLTPEERYIVNSHMIHSIKMLSALPFPRTMKNIIEIAGSHHEKMEGGGYPRNIKAKELPLAARAMAIADIFEALTASDRPYKKSKSLSEALGIMQKMVREKHIDAGLFKLFVQSGKAEEYARMYLQQEQMDAVDIAGLTRDLS